MICDGFEKGRDTRPVKIQAEDRLDRHTLLRQPGTQPVVSRRNFFARGEGEGRCKFPPSQSFTPIQGQQNLPRNGRHLKQDGFLNGRLNRLRDSDRLQGGQPSGDGVAAERARPLVVGTGAVCVEISRRFHDHADFHQPLAHPYGALPTRRTGGHFHHHAAVQERFPLLKCLPRSRLP